MIGEKVPMAYCSKCGAWIWGGPYVRWTCYCVKAQPMAFNRENGEYVICATRKAFNQFAWQIDKKVKL